MSDAPSRILVVEDDPSVRHAVESSLRGDGYEVCAVADGTGLSEVLARFRPDLAILDLRLPSGPDGMALARSIRAQSAMPMILFTAVDAVDRRVEGLDAGADDYVTKPFAMSELLARVRALLRRTGRLHSQVIEVGDLLIDPGTRSAFRADEELDLTPTEFHLLATLARNVGQVLSKTRILSLVWGFDAYDENLVEVHVSSLRRKLEAHGPRVLHTVRGAGYVLRGVPPEAGERT